MTDHRIIALIPARGGSTRIKRKNIRPLAGRPLLAWTIAAAKASGIFTGIFISTEDEEIGRTALAQGDVCWIKRPAEMAESDSPDIAWIEHALTYETSCAGHFDCFAILRPTSPLRTAETIRRAWGQWIGQTSYFDSLRAVEPVSGHPCKMWVAQGQEITPNCQCWPSSYRRAPHHSMATQSLPPRLIQNASLEIAWTQTVEVQRSIAGERVMPFLTEGYEGLDLNDELDWLFLEFLVERGLAKLPEVEG